MTKTAHTLFSRLKSFKENQSGATAMMMAVAAVPVVMAAGVAVDFGNATSYQARLQNAADAAALAAGREANKTQAELEAIARPYFLANYAAKAGERIPTMSLVLHQDGKVNIRGQVQVKNYLTSIAGYNYTTVAANSQVKKDANGLEVVLVFDNTGSMGRQSRLPTLKVAAREFVNILFGPRETAPTLKIGVVPFSQFVNVGPDKANRHWLDTNGLSPYSRANFRSNQWHNWRAWGSIRNRSWTGCVESRPGNLSVEDTPADIANGATMFPPAFAPDEPGTNTSTAYFNTGSGYIRYRNSYLRDSRTNSLDMRQRHERKYQNARLTTTSRGPDRGCNIQPILALTNVKQPIVDRLNAMRASGYTHVAEGVGWGLRVLSPSAPFTEGVAYSDDKITKAMVLLTDGENTFDSENNHNRSTYTAYGMLNQERLGSRNYTTAITAQNNLLRRACNNVKREEIVVYSFAYNVPSATQRALIKSCASDPEKYFDPPTNEALVRNFRQIADELRKLHLSE